MLEFVVRLTLYSSGTSPPTCCSWPELTKRVEQIPDFPTTSAKLLCWKLLAISESQASVLRLQYQF